ncbi:Exodeoxyribonuclease VII large subunit [Ruminococcaceae bacterium YRB3002]|nr:Exodeoxyribonuclease VII large subunit [Ruminococcaceae bacterium YRB3002]
MFKFESVTALNNYVNDYLGNEQRLSGFELTGEISAFTRAYSGHCYIDIKDETSVVSCIMYKRYFDMVDFQPAVGDKVKICGSAGMYVPQGRFQIRITSMSKSGSGDLYARYQELYKSLQKEGLFLQEHKKKIPVLPRRIGVVTSMTGAVIHDIVDTLRRRNPNFHILVYPAAVQGASCAEEVISGLRYLEDNHLCDVIIVARGGGSYEDLFGFNDEEMARTVYDLSTPVISAIGHEVDYTILDAVADLRAPTPTAAAELCMGNLKELSDSVDSAMMALDVGMTNIIDSREHMIRNYADHKALATPLYFAMQQMEIVNGLSDRLDSSVRIILDSDAASVRSVSGRLEELNPLNVLKRGYSFISDSQGIPVESADRVNPGDKVNIFFADGSASASIDDVRRNN